MELASIVRQYQSAYEKKYAQVLLPSHQRAMEAIKICRESECGEILVICPGCGKLEFKRHSCGNRHCPKCQNHEATLWLDHQRRKLLPVKYFLVTFTVPGELRKGIYAHQQNGYACFFQAASETLQDLAANERYLGGKIGLTGVLHTHNRRLDFHPHVHFLVPAACLEKGAWKKKRWKFLFPEKALASVFREKLLRLFARKEIPFPKSASTKRWVVNCRMVGTGAPALEYLSRYLYRGIISERSIIRNEDGRVTFRYRENKSGAWKTRTESGEDFLRLVFQHVLPKGFRRARDYGFLHGRAKKTLVRLQLLLRVRLPEPVEPKRPQFLCTECGAEMRIIVRKIFRSELNLSARGIASP